MIHQDFFPITEAMNRAEARKQAAEVELAEIKSNWLLLLADVAMARKPEKTLAQVRARRTELETVIQEHPAVMQSLENESCKVSARLRFAERERKAKQERTENLGGP